MRFKEFVDYQHKKNILVEILILKEQWTLGFISGKQFQEKFKEVFSL